MNKKIKIKYKFSRLNFSNFGTSFHMILDFFHEGDTDHSFENKSQADSYLLLNKLDYKYSIHKNCIGKYVFKKKN